MSAAYSLSVGYMSGSDYGFQGSEEEAWELMKSFARELCQSPDRIYQEALRIGDLAEVSAEEIEPFLDAYRIHTDLTMKFIDEPIQEDMKPYIRQSASGDDPERGIKEALRRAFCRLMIEAMHRKHIEVRLQV